MEAEAGRDKGHLAYGLARWSAAMWIDDHSLFPGETQAKKKHGAHLSLTALLLIEGLLKHAL